MSHKVEKQALRETYRGVVNRFKKKVEKTNLPPAEKERRATQRKTQKAPTAVVDWTGKTTWKRGVKR